MILFSVRFKTNKAASEMHLDRGRIENDILRLRHKRATTSDDPASCLPARGFFVLRKVASGWSLVISIEFI